MSGLPPDSVGRPRRLLYCEGPGDIVQAFRTWRDGRDYATETSLTFSGQLFDHCRRNRIEMHAVSYCGRRDVLVDGLCTVTNLPRIDFTLPKIGYQLTLLVYALRLLMLALRLRPDVIYITSGVIGWTFCGLLRLSGARIVPVLHNTLWPEGRPPKGRLAMLRMRCHRWLWRRAVAATMVVSPAAARQVASVAGAHRTPIVEFRPSFPAHAFAADVPTRLASERPFGLMYAGRIEADKGVFDLLTMARALHERWPGRYRLALCGDGGALAEVRRRIVAEGLQAVVEAHGRLDRPALIARYLEAHLVLVPTRSSFAEGYAQVVAEAVLLLRPVLTSSLVPAAELCAEAVMLATPDDAESYADAVEALVADPARYDRLVAGARRLRGDLLGDGQSFGEGLAKVEVQLQGMQ